VGPHAQAIAEPSESCMQDGYNMFYQRIENIQGPGTCPNP
jgi:hypothetical protein